MCLIPPNLIPMYLFFPKTLQVDVSQQKEGKKSRRKTIWEIRTLTQGDVGEWQLYRIWQKNSTYRSRSEELRATSEDEHPIPPNSQHSTVRRGWEGKRSFASIRICISFFGFTLKMNFCFTNLEALKVFSKITAKYWSIYFLFLVWTPKKLSRVSS